MTSISQLLPYQRGERVLITGSSGTGKSYGAGSFLQAQEQRVLVLDPKRTDSVNRWNWPVVTELEQVEQLGKMRDGGRLVWRPSWNTTPEELFTQVEILCQWAFQTGDMIVYLDEIKQICPSPQKCPPSLRGLAILGREREVGFWGATQRPVGVPVELMSEANHYIIFALNREQDGAELLSRWKRILRTTSKRWKIGNFMYQNPRKRLYSGPHWFE